MAFCENCGTQLSNGAKFCSSCGKPAGAGASSTPSTPSQTSNAKMKWILGGGVLLGLLGVGVALYFSHRASVSQTPEAQAAAIIKGIPDVSPILKALQSPAAQSPAATAASVTHARRRSRREQNRYSRSRPMRALQQGRAHSSARNQLHPLDADATGCTYKGDAAARICPHGSTAGPEGANL